MEERLGIAGTGTIACGLAVTAARHADVVVCARSRESAERAAGRLEKAFERAGDGADPSRVNVVTEPAELAAADRTFVVEAIAEDAGAKRELLAALDAALPADAVLATTTSSLSVADLATATGRHDRFLGLHVFNPVPKMELVEVAAGPDTSPRTRERALALCRALGKTPVEVPDVPGFVVNRLLFPYLFSAVALLEETGMSAAGVDACMKLGAGHPMGPLALLDLVGLDVAAAIGESIGTPVPARIRELLDEGALGRKSGRGFHTYP